MYSIGLDTPTIRTYGLNPNSQEYNSIYLSNFQDISKSRFNADELQDMLSFNFNIVSGDSFGFWNDMDIFRVVPKNLANGVVFSNILQSLRLQFFNLFHFRINFV